MPISLFYHYTDVEDVEGIASRLRAHGVRLHLAGRIRIASEGINGTFGGNHQSVEQFHAIVVQQLQAPTIDFKIAAGSADNFPNGWNVRVCDELVTLGVNSKQTSWRDAANHIDPVQFRKEIEQEIVAPTDRLVVLDVRNQYEHAIGKFDNALLPPIRQFSDFPSYLEENQERFVGKRVLMYCTGGVRCERASALLKQVGNPSSIAQLQGGIVRFLEKYPCGGGIFKGKNLVFDTRMAVSTSKPTVVGQCICCGLPWDDYSSQWRCSYCRSRVIICQRAQCAQVFSSRFKSLCNVCSQTGRVAGQNGV